MASGGCGPSDHGGRVAVTGVVTVDGEPLAAGAVALEPASDAVPTAVGARVRAGTFAIERAKGPIPGVYRVRIYASSREQAPKPPGAGERTRRPMLERIPPEYNARSDRLVEIRPDGPNRLRFDIDTVAGASR
jgi:hypothetical protein